MDNLIDTFEDGKASINLCQTYGKTELLGLKHRLLNVSKLVMYIIILIIQTVKHMNVNVFSHYLNVKTNQCEDVESIGIIPPLINYFLNIPMLIIAFVIAYRLYINKATEFWRKNPQYKNNKKLNPAMKAALIACIFLFFVLFALWDLFISIIIYQRPVHHVGSPMHCRNHHFLYVCEITRKQLVNRKRQMRNNRIEKW